METNGNHAGPFYRHDTAHTRTLVEHKIVMLYELRITPRGLLQLDFPIFVLSSIPPNELQPRSVQFFRVRISR